MPLDSICEWPVERLTEVDCQLHLWVTSPFLIHAPRVIQSWGFDYKSSFVWCKPRLGMGNYWRISHEFLLVGARGSATFERHDLRSWDVMPAGRHSKKPELVREWVETAGKPPRIELFARREVAGWDCIGNEVEGSLFSW